MCLPQTAEQYPQQSEKIYTCIDMLGKPYINKPSASEATALRRYTNLIIIIIIIIKQSDWELSEYVLEC